VILNKRYNKFLAYLAVILILTEPADALAYIGPGAGFALITSFFAIFVSFLLAILSLLSFPFRKIWGMIFNPKPEFNAFAKKVIVLGLDGLDPQRTRRYMSQNKLPNLQKLNEMGSFKNLGTTLPPISPVAWSSFITGSNPARHNIFDFLSADKQNYIPDLSSTRTTPAKRTITIGKWKIPLGKPKITLLQKSRPFWHTLSDYGILSAIIRTPITYPPEKFKGVLLSGMCVPDLLGSQGTFTYYSSSITDTGNQMGGQVVSVTLNGNKVTSHLIGPENSLLKDSREMHLPFSIEKTDIEEKYKLTVCGKSLTIEEGKFTNWVQVVFKPGLGIKVRGICKFLLHSFGPEFKLYVSPLQIDPRNPALPVSYPGVFASYLAALQGRFATLGLAEDTWALNEGALDEQSFLDYSYTIHKEREEMFFHMIKKIRKGVCVCVFDITDRVQHMFMRNDDPKHPANRGKETVKYKNVLEDLYMNMDKMVGRAMKEIDRDTLLIVMSDHGFAQFKRGVNLNTWLMENGYLHLKENSQSECDLSNVDWSKTKAYSIGLSGIYLNIKGREKLGIVERGEESLNVKNEISEKLSSIRDGNISAINKVFDSEIYYSGPYVDNAPDLIIGYNKGYRASWDGVLGKISPEVFEDNIKHWSGDHCIDPSLVPGVIFCNRIIDSDSPHITDIGPSVLRAFGIKTPAFMDGKSIFQNGNE